MMDDLKKLVQKHWGFATLRPLQDEAMRAVLEGRDSLLVLPTGGGKSLCFQAPAVLRGGTTVVISPLIALMKDQVDGLQACGIPAVQLDSSLSARDRFNFEQDVRDGAVRLLFVSPERLMMPEFHNLCRQVGVKTFAIDEAHCISHWGHDFRPEYRMMSRIKELFPGVSVHGYTATATEQVRDDICKQLALRDPLVLVGNFDRPNLTYRVLRRANNVETQMREVLDRHQGEAGIIYCLSKKNVDETNALVRSWGFKSEAYHAGKTTEERTRVQELFINEDCDIVVATVAFGMGIDRSNIRFVMHTSMPKSIEHYQQETGRGGRDGLEAECVLLHSGADFMTWRGILEKSAQENNVDADFLPNALKHLTDIDNYARGAVCRHKALVGYFGQTYTEPSCAACDLCLGDVEIVAEAEGLVIAQKILSCVARVKERFGVNHVIGVLRADDSERIRQLGHDKLSTFGLLKDHSVKVLRDWIFQLIGQGVLAKVGDEYPVLKLNLASWEVMKGKQKVQLVQPVRKKSEKVKASRADVTSWDGVERNLFEAIRKWRFELAKQTGKPPYVIFSDETLRQLARVRPSDAEKLRLIYGIGDQKLRTYGHLVLSIIKEYCEEHGLSMDNDAGPIAAPEPTAPRTMTAVLAKALQLFREGAALEDVMHQTGRTRGTVADYLCEFIRLDKPAAITTWVAADVYAKVAEAVKTHGSARLKPLFIALEEKVPYDDIRIIVAHLNRDSL